MRKDNRRNRNEKEYYDKTGEEESKAERTGRYVKWRKEKGKNTKMRKQGNRDIGLIIL